METQQKAAGARVRSASEILHAEAAAIAHLARHMPTEFSDAVEAILACRGQVVLSGMGKAGLIGRKISATFASTGTRSIFVHPSEAVHGDLGRIGPSDVILLLSYSGETEELNRLIPVFNQLSQMVIAITSSPQSSLARNSQIVLTLGALREACPLGLAPSTSTTVMLALGDALALVVAGERGWTREDFARNHPAGNLGKMLARVEQVMRPMDQCRFAHADSSVCDVIVRVSRPGRRSGAVMLIDAQERLVGIFTDSDLARLLEQRRHWQLDSPMADVMTRAFRTVRRGSPLATAIDILARHKISELPVVDEECRPLGMIDITDVVGLVSQAEQLQESSAATQLRVYPSVEPPQRRAG